jgi:hypothetical protein
MRAHQIGTILLLQRAPGGIHDEKWRQISIGEKVPSDSCGRVDIVQRRSKSQPGEIPSDASAWAASRVGDKLERNPRRLNPRNRVEGARQERVADINDALEVEQYAADGAGISSDRQATPVLHRSHPIAFDGMFRDCRLANSSQGAQTRAQHRYRRFPYSDVDYPARIAQAP